MKTKNTTHLSVTASNDTTQTILHNMQIPYTHKSDKNNGTKKKLTADNVLWAKHNKCSNHDRGHRNMTIMFLFTLMEAISAVKHGVVVVSWSLIVMHLVSIYYYLTFNFAIFHSHILRIAFLWPMSLNNK